MQPKLTEGFIQRVVSGEDGAEQAVLQLLHVFHLEGNADLYQLVVSDGSSVFPYCVLHCALNHLISGNILEELSVFRLEQFSNRLLPPSKRFVLVTCLTVLVPGAQVGEQIWSESTLPVCELSVYTEASDASGTPASVYERSTVASQTSAWKFTQDQLRILSEACAEPTLSSSVPPQLAAPHATTLPIVSLNPYQARWTICGRVTSKSQVFRWKNQGRMFTIVVADASGEVGAVAFAAECDKFFPIIQIGQAYHICRAAVKPTKLASRHPFELKFTPSTTVEPCPQDSPSQMGFSPVPLSQLGSFGSRDLIDVVGICVAAEPLLTMEHRGAELKRRDVLLLDKTGTQVTLTLWGEEAEKFDDSDNPVLAIKNARVSDFGGRSLNQCAYSWLLVDPDMPGARELREWFMIGGTQLEQLDPEPSLQMLAQGLDSSLNFTAVAWVKEICPDDCFYQVCPKCTKEVWVLSEGGLWCLACEEEFSRCEWRLKLKVNIADSSACVWASCYHRTAEAILGISASELSRKLDSREAHLKAILGKAIDKPFTFHLCFNTEASRTGEEPQLTIASASPLSRSDYGKELLDGLRS